MILLFKSYLAHLLFTKLVKKVILDNTTRLGLFQHVLKIGPFQPNSVLPDYEKLNDELDLRHKDDKCNRD